MWRSGKKWEEEQKKIKILKKEELENLKKEGENFFDNIIINNFNVLRNRKKVRIEIVHIYFLDRYDLIDNNLVFFLPDKYFSHVFNYLKEIYKEVGWILSFSFPYYSINIRKIN